MNMNLSNFDFYNSCAKKIAAYKLTKEDADDLAYTIIDDYIFKNKNAVSPLKEFTNTLVSPFKAVGSAFINKNNISKGLQNLYNTNIDTFEKEISDIASRYPIKYFQNLNTLDKLKYTGGALLSPIYNPKNSEFNKHKSLQQYLGTSSLLNYANTLKNNLKSKDISRIKTNLLKGYYNNPNNAKIDQILPFKKITEEFKSSNLPTPEKGIYNSLLSYYIKNKLSNTLNDKDKVLSQLKLNILNKNSYPNLNTFYTLDNNNSIDPLSPKKGLIKILYDTLNKNDINEIIPNIKNLQF